MYVLFWFRKSESKQEIENRQSNPNHDSIGNICCRVTIDTQFCEIGSVHIQLKRSQWLESSQLVAGRDETARRFNRKISDIKSKLERIYELLELEHGENVSPHMVKDLFTGKKLFRYTFSQLITEYLKDRTEEVSAGLITKSTLDVHENYAQNFEIFLKDKSLQKMLPANFDEDNLDTFKIHLTSQKFAHSHTRKHLGFVKQLLKHSMKKKRIKQNLLFGLRIPNKDKEPDTTHLSVPQLYHLINFNFQALVKDGFIHPETASKLEKERDAFVFTSFSGMHHCDYTKKDYWLENFNDSIFLKGRRLKTDKVFSMKLLQPAIDILNKYGGKIENLPTKSNQKRNSTLKELSIICRIPILLSTKIARKTFADMALNVLLLDEGDVASCLGLTSTRSLRHYTKIREERIALKMTSWDDILNKVA